MNRATATESVIKKLNALRATLTDEEQVAFDQLVVRGEEGDDVEAHVSLRDRDNSDFRFK